MASRSAISTHVSNTPTSQGTYQRSSNLSMTSQMSSSGTWVPVWLGEERKPGPGASMMPPAIRPRTSPVVPVARPLATSTASVSSKV